MNIDLKYHGLSTLCIPVTHNLCLHRFEMRAGDEPLAFLSYVHEGDCVIFDHTYVPDGLRERGLAATLVRAALDEARQKHWKVVTRCSYVAGFIEGHREFDDLVDQQGRDLD